MVNVGGKDTERLEALHEKFARHHLKGLWQREGEKPAESRPAVWRWTEILPILEESMKVVRLPEDTDQRVIGLTGPGREATNRAVSLAYQLLNPGESVGSHRHTPTQMRFIVEGKGAYTTSEGEQMFMEAGDLLVQPNWTWHGTASLGEGPTVWLDIQDRNLVNYLGAFVRELWPEGKVQPATRAEDYHRRLSGALRPSVAASGTLPPYRYKWSDTQQALEELLDGGVRDPYDGALFEYTNPLTGGSTVPTMSARIQALRPSETTRSHRHTGTTIYHVIEGEGASIVNGEELKWHKRDCFLTLPLQWHSHQNLSTHERAILFSVSDRPVLEALGLYREEAK
jgi:gentisate 1,2-dioxygenase